MERVFKGKTRHLIRETESPELKPKISRERHSQEGSIQNSFLEPESIIKFKESMDRKRKQFNQKTLESLFHFPQMPKMPSNVWAKPHLGKRSQSRFFGKSSNEPLFSRRKIISEKPKSKQKFEEPQFNSEGIDKKSSKIQKEQKWRQEANFDSKRVSEWRTEEDGNVWKFDHQNEDPWVPEQLRRLEPNFDEFDYEQIEECESVCVPCKEFLVHKSIPLPVHCRQRPAPTFDNLRVTNEEDTRKLIDFVDTSKSKQFLRNPLNVDYEDFSDVEPDPFCAKTYQEKLHSMLDQSQLTLLRRLFPVMVKLLSDQEIFPREMELSAVEKQLLLIFIKKKKFHGHERLGEVSCEYLNRARKKRCFKRTEEHFKYVFKKCFRFMANKFRAKRFSQIQRQLKAEFRGSKFKFEYVFYGYYFGKIAGELNLPIEKFFHFRIKRGSNSISTKTVSKLYLGYLKMNPQFLEGFKRYIECKMLNETYYLILSKTRNLLRNWENTLNANGLLAGVDSIRKNLTFNVKSKLPWSIKDVEHSSNLTLEYIRTN